MKKQLIVPVDESGHMELKMMAVKEGKTIASLVRKAIKESYNIIL